MYVMRKTVSFLALLLTSICSNAQFCLKEGGLYVCNSDKNYIVEEFPELSQDEIYKRAKTSLVLMYNSAKDVLSYEVNEAISIKGISTKDVFIKNMGVKGFVRVDYKINILFKEGKMRIDVPSIELFTGNKQIPMYLIRGSAIDNCAFKKNGELRGEGLEESLTGFFNYMIKSLIENINSGNLMNDDW